MASGNADLVLAEIGLLQAAMNGAPCDACSQTQKTARPQQRERIINMIIQTAGFANSDPMNLAKQLKLATEVPFELSELAQTTLVEFIQSTLSDDITGGGGGGVGISEELAKMLGDIL